MTRRTSSPFSMLLSFVNIKIETIVVFSLSLYCVVNFICISLTGKIMSRRNLPSRIESFIDENRILPAKGSLYQLKGGGRSGKSMRIFAEAWTALNLLNGNYVHWIDGACRFNPARIMKYFPHDIPESDQLLHGLFVGRGFTVHQFAQLISRLKDEIRISKAKMIVVDGPVTMHLDHQINEYEARSLLRKSMNILEEIAKTNNVPVVVITASRPYSKRHSTLLKLVSNRCKQSLLGKHKTRMGRKKLWLLHTPSGHSGFKLEEAKHETIFESASRVIHSRLSLEGIEEIE